MFYIIRAEKVKCEVKSFSCFRGLRKSVDAELKACGALRVHDLLLAVAAEVVVHHPISCYARQQACASSKCNLHATSAATLISIRARIAVRSGHRHVATIVVVCIILVRIAVGAHTWVCRVAISAEAASTASRRAIP